ncbi:MAG: histidine kinase [Spirosomaceae bacterium]|nr:histidine kinase [Spirosomataceae bacterium]
MKKNKRKYLLFFALWLIGFWTIAQKEIVLSESENEVELSQQEDVKILSFIDSPMSSFDVKDLRNNDFQERFIPNQNNLNFGYTSSTAWVKFDLKNESGKDWLLELDNPSIDNIELYLVDNQMVMSIFVAGDRHPIESYIIKDRNPIFPLKLSKDKVYTVYLKGNSTEELNFKLRFWDSNSLYPYLANRNLLWGIFFGFILVISFYNFFLWLTIRDLTYLYYIIYVLSFGFFQFSLYGFGFQYGWGSGIFNEKAHVLFLGLSVTFLAIFSLHFLDLFKTFPNSRRFFNILGLIWFTVYIFMVITFSHQTRLLLLIMSIVGVVFQYYFSIKLWLKGNKSVRYYLLATLAFSIACVIIILKNFVDIFSGDYYLKLGSMIEMVLFSVALGDKYRQIELDRIRQQRIRDEISANLHDDLAASLSSLTMFSELNRRKAMKISAEYTEIFKNFSEKSREILNMVRENVWEMNPRNDVSDEWLDRMVKFVKEILETKQIDLDLKIDEEIQSTIIPIDQRRDLFLFFKECINNAAKYSEASLVKIQLLKHKNNLDLSIEDNGKGFEINGLYDGNGMVNLRNRAEKLNGKYKIESRIGEGTKISLTFKIATNISS